MPRILIADDHAVFRQGLNQLLGEQIEGVVFGEAATAQEVLELVWHDRWDIVVLDVSMPGRSGIEILREIKKSTPQLPILVLSSHPEEQYGVRVVREGASGYLNKASEPREIVGAIKRILSGGLYITPSLAEQLATAVAHPGFALPHEKLSARELQVLQLTTSGKSVKEIAAELRLSGQTVFTYRARLMEKMGFKTSAQAMRYAIDNKLIE